MNLRTVKDKDGVFTKEPPKLSDFLQKRVLKSLFLIATILSILLFVVTFYSTWKNFQNQEMVSVAQLERDWSSKIDSFGKFLNVLSDQFKIFQDEYCTMNLLRSIYENHSPLFVNPTFARADGKMFSYPFYDYGPDYDPRKRPWYQTALKDPENYVVVERFTHVLSDEPAIAVAKAVLDEQKNLLGVLALDLVASRIAETLLVNDSYILDETGQIIAKKGEVKALFKPDPTKGKQLVIRTFGLTHYIAKPSIFGTYVVVEHDFSQHVWSVLMPPSIVFGTVFIVSLFIFSELRRNLKRAVIDPIEKVVEAARNYLSFGEFDLQQIQDPVHEVKVLVDELSDMVTIIDAQIEELKASYDELENSQLQLEEAFQNLEKKQEEIEEAYRMLTEKLGMLVEGFDEPTGKHIERVKKLSKFLAEKMNLPESLVKQIELYAPLHDVGKVLVPKEILNKPGRLTKEEFELMKKHVLWGAKLFENDDRFTVARNIILYHHERYDGSGYPFGLKDGEIPIEAQIVGLVDVYDALRSERPYKKALSQEEALKIILQGDEKTPPRQFSPELLKVFEEHAQQIEKIWESG